MSDIDELVKIASSVSLVDFVAIISSKKNEDFRSKIAKVLATKKFWQEYDDQLTDRIIGNMSPRELFLYEYLISLYKDEKIMKKAINVLLDKGYFAVVNAAIIEDSTIKKQFFKVLKARFENAKSTQEIIKDLPIYVVQLPNNPKYVKYLSLVDPDTRFRILSLLYSSIGKDLKKNEKLIKDTYPYARFLLDLDAIKYFPLFEAMPGIVYDWDDFKQLVFLVKVYENDLGNEKLRKSTYKYAYDNIMESPLEWQNRQMLLAEPEILLEGGTPAEDLETVITKILTRKDNLLNRFYAKNYQYQDMIINKLLDFYSTSVSNYISLKIVKAITIFNLSEEPTEEMKKQLDNLYDAWFKEPKKGNEPNDENIQSLLESLEDRPNVWTKAYVANLFLNHKDLDISKDTRKKLEKLAKE